MTKTIAANKADANTIAADTSASPQSQLNGLTGNVATINPQGDTARFVLADIKGKDAAVSYRLSVIRTAVLELLKGNSRNFKEAVALVPKLGSAAKAKAYSAGFAALSDIGKLGATGAIEGTKHADGSIEAARTGKWTDDSNAQLRTIADTLADAYTLQFDSAYNAVINGTKDKAAATRAANKAAKEQAAAAAAQASAPQFEQGDDSADDSAVDSALLIESALATVVTLAQQGMLSDDQMTTLRAALGVVEVEADTNIGHLLSSAAPVAPAHAH